MIIMIGRASVTKDASEARVMTAFKQSGKGYKVVGEVKGLNGAVIDSRTADLFIRKWGNK